MEGFGESRGSGVGRGEFKGKGGVDGTGEEGQWEKMVKVRYKVLRV